MQLYSITDDEFSVWIKDPGTTLDDLYEARSVLAAKQAALWKQGHHDSYYRDRYERDERYTKRLLAVREEIVRRVDEVEHINPFDGVLKFHETYGMVVGDFSHPAINDERLALRVDLIEEELKEVGEAIANDDIVNLAKELADLVYVTYGMAIEFGIRLDAVFDEVQRSNMSKLGEDGKPIYREDGKVLKGPNYREADGESVLREGK